MVLIFKNLDPLHQRMLCVTFGWNWSTGSGGEDIYKCHLSIFAILLLSPLEKGSNPSFEHAWIPFTSGSWEEVKNVKSLQTEGQIMDDMWSEKLT